MRDSGITLTEARARGPVGDEPRDPVEIGFGRHMDWDAFETWCHGGPARAAMVAD